MLEWRGLLLCTGCCTCCLPVLHSGACPHHTPRMLLFTLPLQVAGGGSE